jgi:hypothetical protein
MKAYLLASFFFFTSFIFSQEVIISTFDVDNEGWTVNGGILYYHGSGGNPDGFIEFEDDQDGKGVFLAPGKFLGDLTPYDQGTIKFDLKNTVDNGQDSLSGYGNVKISSSSSSAEKNVVPLGYYSEWTSFTIPLTANDWGLTESGWDSLLSDVTEISIQMDGQWNYYDRSGLDNFSINPFSSDVKPYLIDSHPSKYKLDQNYPNPFNPTTRIRFSVHELSFVKLKVYDIVGNEIETLVNQEKPAGSYEVQFSAVDLPSGVYFYRIQAGGFIDTKKMILLK